MIPWSENHNKISWTSIRIWQCTKFPIIWKSRQRLWDSPPQRCEGDLFIERELSRWVWHFLPILTVIKLWAWILMFICFSGCHIADPSFCTWEMTGFLSLGGRQRLPRETENANSLSEYHTKSRNFNNYSPSRWRQTGTRTRTWHCMEDVEFTVSHSSVRKKYLLWTLCSELSKWKKHPHHELVAPAETMNSGQWWKLSHGQDLNFP